MARNDREHFEEYRLQTRVKHEILRAYLRPYLQIAKQQHRVLRYIDGFAGRGHYGEHGDRSPGSPVLILEFLASSPDLSKLVRTHFIEQDSLLFESLCDAVDGVLKSHPELVQPDLRQGSFAVEVPAILTEVEEKHEELGATFLFVDPCGVSGIDLRVVAEIISRHFCELFLFFNSNGLNRVVAAFDRPGNAEVVAGLYGESAAARQLAERIAQVASPLARERLLLDEFRRRICEIAGAQYFLPFRIEAEDRRATSHYLIHVSKHPLGFTIMKDVMLETIPKLVPSAGQLGLRQASAGFESELIDCFSRQDLRTKVLQRLGNGVLTVRDLVAGCEAPDDYDSPRAWKQAALSLEREGLLGVFHDPGCSQQAPASLRRKRGGAPTLADKFYVRLIRSEP